LRSVRLEAADAIVRLQRLFAAGVDVIDRGMVGVYDSLEFAARHGLSVYDAAYLSLAVELDGELATNDRALAHAARAEGVEVID
jgi:predicted nucleic acid-binding protein